LALILEKCPENRIVGSGLLFVYLIVSSFGLGWLGTSKNYNFMERIIMSMGTCLFLVSVSAYTFWPPTLPRGGAKAVILTNPSIAPVLFGPRIISAPMGVIAGVFTTMKTYHACIEAQGTYWGFLTSVLCGLIVSLMYSLGTDSIIEKRSSQLAIGVGTMLSVLFGVYVKWYIGVVVGSVIGCILGAIVEHYTMRSIMAETTILMQPGDAKPYKASLRTDGTTLYPSQAVRPESAGSDTTPTRVIATPRSQSSELAELTKATNEGNFQTLALSQADSTQLYHSHGRSKRFGFHQQADNSNLSPARTHNTSIAWNSPVVGTPSESAIAQGWTGNDWGGSQSNWTQGSGRSASSPPGAGRFSTSREVSARGGSQGSLRGAAQGGLPSSQSSGRQENRQIASVVRATSRP